MKRCFGVWFAAVVAGVAACGGAPEFRWPSRAEGMTALVGEYLGQKPPGSAPQLFAEGFVSTGLHDDGAPRFSPDGREVYFRKWAVPHDVVGFMRMMGGRWTEPAIFHEFGRFVVSPPIFELDGTGAYFLSRRPRDGVGDPADYNIWHASKTADGWGELVLVESPLNTPGDEFPYSVSASGTLYLQGKYADTLGNFDIYYSRLVEGSHEPPRNLGAPVNTQFSEGAPFVSPDESFIVYSSYGGPDGIGGMDIYVTFRSQGGGWSKGINLGPEVNSSDDDKFPALSPDGRYLFFVSHRGADRSYILTDLTYRELISRNLGPRNGQGDVYWVSADVIRRLQSS